MWLKHYGGGGVDVQKWELAYIDYQNGMKYKDIAAKHDVSINTVKSWKSRKWNAPPEKKGATKKEKVAHKKEVQPVIDNDDLTEQQKLFCLHYLECFNATKAYQKAYRCDYRTAHANSYRMMANDGIKSELHRLKAEMQQDVFLDVKDLMLEYIKQAFADITDFTEFGKREVPVMGMFGPVKDEDGRELMKEINYVDFKESTEIDGKLIKEVKVGKDGVSVKLYDKQKAMSELMKYLGGDRLREVQIAAAIAKNKDGSEEFDMEDDGFLAALESEGEELWPEE
ncbi:terminase small subunit [Enterococcus casseliflavus]|uniref:terminase small subunit n=1 Tax=Enterococcus casseliflavus TaxID=37734 RepID=UPI001D160BB2|nr:terminase small subunit [Enterococcus casseliflavus]